MTISLTAVQPSPIKEDEHGVFRIGGTRVSLDSIVSAYQNGATAEQIAEDFPTLDLADIHIAIGLYLRHPNEVANYLIAQEQRADEVRRQIAPSSPKTASVSGSSHGKRPRNERMLRLLSDEDFNGHILRGVLRLLPALDLVRAIDMGLSSMRDPSVLEFAATDGRVLITHDAATMPAFAYERVNAGTGMPGIIVSPQSLGIGEAIRDIALLAELSDDDEWENQVIYLPL